MGHTVRHFLRGDARDVKLCQLDTDTPGVFGGDGYRVKERLFGWRSVGGVVSSWRDRRRRSSRGAANALRNFPCGELEGSVCNSFDDAVDARFTYSREVCTEAVNDDLTSREL